MKVLIDNGHGVNTPGKQSPDGRLREYMWARQFADMLVEKLLVEGIMAERLVPEEVDISLRERCRRVNAECARLGTNNVLVVSIHNNAAASDAKWHTARGFTAHVSLNASDRSKALAKCLWDAVIGKSLQGNRCIPDERYIRQNLAICRDTKCAAVLTENLFQDNRDDVDTLLSWDGKRALLEAHVEGIKKFLGL